jgi:hypothetical protein
VWGTVINIEVKDWSATSGRHSTSYSAMLVLLLIACAAMPRDAWALENGAPQWPVGVQTIMPAVLPAAGETAYYNYTLYYHADSFKDRNGDDSIPGFDLSVLAEAPRIVHTWKTKLGPLNMSSGIILAGNFVKVELDAMPSLHVEDSTFGLNYLYLTPLYLTYNTPTLHLLYGPGVFIPVGQFDADDFANPTNNYYSVHQELAITYLPVKTLEFSAEMGLTLNADNPETDYHSGASFDVEWGINWAPIASIPNLFFGIQGYYIDQFTDDQINGAKVGPDGFRLERNAFGPQLIYYFSPKAGVAAKYTREFEAKNAPEGDRFWIQFVTPIRF